MCAGCTKKALELAKTMKTPETPQTPQIDAAPRLSMQCAGCGLTRLLPTGLNVNDTFELVPCPKCNKGFRGQFVGNGVQELL